MNLNIKKCADVFVYEKRQVTICAAALLMVLGFVVVRYMPLRKKMKIVEQAKTSQVLAMAEQTRQSKELPALKEKLTQLQVEAKNYQLQIPNERGLGLFLHKVTDMMNTYELSDQLIQPGSEMKVDELTCIPINMRCKGRLVRLFDFYESMQNLDRLVRFELIKLSNDSQFSGEASMETKAFVYYR